MTVPYSSVPNALRETAERFRALIENSCEGIVLVDAEGKVLYVSPAEERILGRKPEESVGTNGFGWVHPEDVPVVQARFAEALQNPGKTIRQEMRAQHKNGEWRWIECSSRNLLDDPNIRGIVVNYHDITERKVQEQEARLQRERFEIITRATHDVVWDWDLIGEKLCWNAEFYHRFGYSTEIPATIEFWIENIHPADRDRVWHEVEDVLKKNENYVNVEYAFRHANGNYSDVLDRGFVIRNDKGEAIRMLGSMIDISERKRVEQSIQRLAAFVRNNPNPVFEFSGEGKITYHNEACEHLARQVKKSNPSDLVTPEINEAIQNAIATGIPRENLTSRINLRNLAWWIYPQKDRNVAHCYANDITEKIKLEEQLRQATKMEAIGQLAGGVAHDFNNILTVIEGHAALLGLDPDLKQASSESVAEISAAADRAANLTRQLLTFSRKQVMQPQVLNCNDVVNNITRMLQRILGEDVRLQVTYAPNLPCVLVDAGMLEQVLVNLSVNSRDAMPNGGTLSIGTCLKSIDAAYVAANPDASVGKAVCICVTDTGTGIRREDLSRIFEPFFTTKEVGKGTGLGLATVYGIVKQHRGWIVVESEWGHGTTFKIFLPASEEKRSGGLRKPDSPVRSGKETILLVEDEGPVRSLTSSVLQLYGYKIIEAATGREAWDIWQKRCDEIDLILTDMVMPDGVSGRELVEKVRERNPAAKALYVSGYSSDLVGDSILPQGVRFLQKPYHPDELCNAIRRCLDDAEARPAAAG